MLFEGDEVLFPQADVARGVVVLVTADQVGDDGGGHFGVRAMRTNDATGYGTMRTSFFGYEKSKCALPVPTALFRGKSKCALPAPTALL